MSNEADALGTNAETLDEDQRNEYAETLVKRVDADAPSDTLPNENHIVPEDSCHPRNGAQTCSTQRAEQPRHAQELECFVPQTLDSRGKLLKIKDSSNVIFSGRFDAASVCELLGTMAETDLRDLREHLHAALPDAIPATAGRQLARRNAGSSARLVEDCWALGYSVASGTLTTRANSTTLRPIGRSPLEPLPPPSLNVSAISNSMEGLVSAQLRLEAGFSSQQRDIAGLKSEMLALRDLRREITELRAAVVDKDARIAHLEAQVGELLSPANTASSRPTAEESGRSPAGSCQLASDLAGSINLRELGESIAAALRSGAGNSDSEASDDPDWPSLGPRAGGGANRSRPSARRNHARSAPRTAAHPTTRHWADVATTQPINRLAPAPAAAGVSSHTLHTATPSECHQPQAPLVAPPQASCAPPQAPCAAPQAPWAPPQAPRAAPQAPWAPPQAPRAAPQAPRAAPQAPWAPPQAPCAPPQALSVAPPQAPCAAPQMDVTASVETVHTLSFLLEGVDPNIPDAHVRSLVLGLTSLNDFQRVKRHSGARLGLKAFRFDVDARDAATVMSPFSWPPGLRVRPWTVTPAGGQYAPAATSGPGQRMNTTRQQSVQTAASGGRRETAPMPRFSSSEPPTRPAATRPSAARHVEITGSGPASELVTSDAAHAGPPSAAFLIDGFHRNVSDAQVRNLVWPLVSNLHQCQRARLRGLQAGARAYRIVVDATDSPAVLNPANWPAGLRICTWPGQHGQSF